MLRMLPPECSDWEKDKERERVMETGGQLMDWFKKDMLFLLSTLSLDCFLKKFKFRY